MKTEIKFGTDGYRGILGKTFTFAEVERILSATSLYLRSLKTPKNTLIVGYDPRRDARKYAEFCANYLKQKGFRVILSSRVVPTPIVAYCAKYYPDSLGAIMLTASHNPPSYQGIKFIPDYGGPAEKEITDKILSFLDKDSASLNGVCPPEEPKSNASKCLCGEIVERELQEEYFSHIQKIIDFDVIRKNPPAIIFDGLYSSTIGYFDKLLDLNNISYKSFNMHHDPDFGGGLPEPKKQFMKHSKKGFITFANDGDGDRFGVIDEEGVWVHPNIVLALLLKYFKKCGKTGKMIKTVGTSAIVDVVAKKLGIETVTTPVGFKWLSREMRKNPDRAILAGEDSGGLSTGAHIPEKDGIFANLLILEMVAREGKKLCELADDIKKFAGCEFICERIDVELDCDKKADDLLEQFSKAQNIAGLEVREKLTLDGLKLFFGNLNTSLLIRKSGTEPLLRFYIESDKRALIDALREFIQNHTN